MNSRTGPSSSDRRRSTAAPDAAEVEHVPGVAETAWTTHVSSDTALFERLLIRHREGQRRYHRIEHVEAVLAHVSDLSEHEATDDLGAVVAAALYHDAIYESQHPANERASARLARRDLESLGWDTRRSAVVAQMIEGTTTHLDPPDTDTAVLFDADLAILGSEPATYRRYVTAVRDEYRHFDDAEWTAGRRSVLRSLLERPVIYATATGNSRWEAAARANIIAELAELER